MFQKGSNNLCYPIKLIYLETGSEYVNPCQAMFVAPKRAFKRAHDRNKLKRRMREAYRLNKESIYKSFIQNEKKMVFAFLFIGKKIEGYSKIESAVIELMKKVENKLS